MPEIRDYHYQGSLRDNKLRQVKELFARLGPRRTGGLILTLLMVIALPVTLIALEQRQELRQKAAELDQYASVGIVPEFPKSCSPVKFSDVSPSLQTPVYCLANVANCVVSGDGSGVFKESDILTRKEAIAYYARFHVNTVKDWTWDTSGNTFSDVSSAHPLFKEIQTAKNKGFTKGKGTDATHPTAWFDPDGIWTFNVTNINAVDPAAYRTNITRGEFIQQLYENGKQSLTSCITNTVVPTYTRCSLNQGCTKVTFQSVDGGQHLLTGTNPTGVVDVACGIISGTDSNNPVNAACPKPTVSSSVVPPTSNYPDSVNIPIAVKQPALVGCDNYLNYPNDLNATYPQLSNMVSCFHKSYCVVMGSYDAHGDTLGYDLKLTRSQFVSFITRYHVEVLKDDWKNTFETIQDYYTASSTKKFYDISADPKSSNYYVLWREIYTAQKMGLVQGYEDNTFQPEELWKYGFHGVTRQDTYKGIGYNFSSPGQTISRGDFLTQLYDYGMNQTKNLSACVLQPTPTHANFPSPAQGALTVSPTKTPVVIATSTPIPTLKPTATSSPISGSLVTIYAEGTLAGGVSPIMDLYIKGQIVKRWTDVPPGIKAYQYSYAGQLTKSDIKIVFSNDAYIQGKDRNLRVDKIQVNGTYYETEVATTYSSGSYMSAYSRCGTGYRHTEWLYCNGYFQFK